MATIQDSKKQRAFAKAVCKELGLDPNDIHNIQVDLDGVRASITWTGVRYVTPQELSQLLYAAEVAAEEPDPVEKLVEADPNLEWLT